MIFGFVIIGVLMVVGLNIVLNANKSRAEKEAAQAKRFNIIYAFLSRFFLTQYFLEGIKRRLTNLSIYRKNELQTLSVKYLLFSWSGGIALIVVSLFMFNDVLNILICIVFGYMLTGVIVDKMIDAQNTKVTKAMAQVLASIRQEYMKTGNIVEAVSDAEVPDLVKKPLDEIATMLTSTNAELKLEEFSSSTPYRTLQTLAAICFHINNQGDSTDVYGQSNFTQALTIMLSDVNAEIQKNAYRKKKFGKIEYLPFIPIGGIGLIENYFMGIMPGTALIYNGPIGYLSKTVTVVLSIICYLIVARINANMPVKEDDRGELVISLMNKPRIRRFVKNISPKGSSRAKVEMKLKSGISSMSVEQLYTKKFISGALAFMLALLTTVSTTSLGREFIQTSTQQLSLVATKEMDNLALNAIRTLDTEYLNNREQYDSNPEAMKSLIKQYMPSLSDLQVQDQVKRLQSKANTLENAYFKWWFFWIAVIVGVIGWFGPNIMLKIRMILIQTEEEEDFLQLQTLVSILMNTNMDTLDLLHELSQQSKVHKDMFLYAYQGYASDPHLELARLRSKTPIKEFQRFIAKLELTISDLSLKEAYSDLLIEREHMVRMRDMSTKYSIDKKRGIAGPLSMTPLGAMIIGEFLIPIGILGYNEFMGAINNM